VEDVLLGFEHFDGVKVRGKGEDDEGAAAHYALVLLGLALLVAFHLLVQEVLQLLEEIRTFAGQFPQEPVAVLLGAHQSA
jgi:hypothetical protein